MFSVVVGVLLPLFFLSAMLQTLKSYEGNFSGFLHISEQFAAKNPFLRSEKELLKTLVLVGDTGYDGQLYYSMAFDPFLTAFQQPGRYTTVVDVPPYRYGRIVFPLLARLLSCADPFVYPMVMVLILFASLSLGTLLFVGILIHFECHPLLGCVYAIIPGFMFSLNFATPEPLAALLLLIGVYQLLRGWTKNSILFFALALLTRETLIVFVLALAGTEFFWNKKKGRALAVLSSVLPLVSWRVYLSWKLWDVYHWTGLYTSVGNISVPYAGVAELYAVILRGEYLSYITPAGVVLPLLLTVMLVVSLRIAWTRKNPFALISALYCLLCLSSTYSKIWVDIANAERGSYEAFVSFFLLIASQVKDPTERNTWNTWFIRSYFLILFLYSFLLSSTDRVFRLACMPWRL